ncbi:F-box and WD repeat domain containing protein 10B [Genypterus blacodes]|uniref:F-box and WD repeat domain containing protein 10B n=1 Tax=Genypterus blacodes TaxID=154954 RepID=UPI003F766EA3
MMPLKSGPSVPHWELDFTKADGCLYMCGICPPCVFATRFLESTESLWNAADACKRRLLVGLLLRCSNVKMLERTQRARQIAPWLTYARSRTPMSPRDMKNLKPTRAKKGDLLETDLSPIWNWFTRSPDRVKSNYLGRVFSRCDPELLRMLGNLTGVLLVRQSRGFLQFNGSNHHTLESKHAGLRSSVECEDSDEDLEEPALRVVPGCSSSMAGVSRYKDFICCLPIPLAKRILGLLDERTLKSCQKVCLYWQRLVEETWKEINFRSNFREQVKAMLKQYKSTDVINSTYANITEVTVPVTAVEREDVDSTLQQAKPFDSPHHSETTTVQLEERNVYCGAFFMKVLLERKDKYRVVDYGGGSLLATGSKDRVLRLLYVAPEPRDVGAMKGHIGSIRAVLLFEERDLVITAGYDAAIRCWSLRTDRCVMVLHGHNGGVNCIDVHEDTLVSGAKDCKVKVWSLATGKPYEEYKFKHPSSVRCVKIWRTKVCSSCEKGLIKDWDMQDGSLLRVIDAHQCSVKCLFLSQWYLISADSSGQVMTWSTNHDTTSCLMNFNHPKEVKSLTLTYLRLITGCVDGKIRIFNFLTGDCLRVFAVADESNRVLSVHFHDNKILVNTTCDLKLCQFSKVSWDYATELVEVVRCGAAAPARLVIEKSSSSLGKTPNASVCTNQQTTLRPQTRGLFTPSKARTQGATPCCEPVKNSVLLSEKAASERVRKRGTHHPLTRDSILLRVSALQHSLCRDETSVNMERNAALRDCWSAHPPPGPSQSDHSALGSHPRSPKSPKRTLQTPKCSLRAQTCVPVLRRTGGENMRSTFNVRDAATAPDTATQPHRCASHAADTQRTVRRTGAKEGPRPPESILKRPTHDCCLKCGAVQRASRVQAETERQSPEGARTEQ